MDDRHHINNLSRWAELDFHYNSITWQHFLPPYHNKLDLTIREGCHWPASASEAFLHLLKCWLPISHLFLLTGRGIPDLMVVSLLAGKMKNLTTSVATTTGCVVALTTARLWHILLGLTAFHQKHRGDLLGALLSPEGLFHHSAFQERRKGST